jgi:hypothetical protein
MFDSAPVITSGEALPVYVLSVHQPMAWAISSGLKDTENRPWKPARRPRPEP